MQDLKLLLDRDGGFTFDPRNARTVEIGDVSGFAIAVPGTERVIGARADLTRKAFMIAFTHTVQDVVTDDDLYVGAWHSTDRDVYMIECTKILDVDRETAVKIGQDTNQEAIFDLGTGELIETGGTGDVAAAS